MFVGNKKIRTQLLEVLGNNKLSHAYLFVGPKNIGKTTFAINFAKNILCGHGEKSCNNCAQCKLFDAGNHPDFYLNDSNDSFGVEESRAVINFLELSPYQAQQKVVVLANAERMTTQAANAFLKTLEEPDSKSVIILTTSNEKNLLPTITSRVQSIKFLPINTEELDEFLKPLGVSETDLEILKDVCGFKVGLYKKMLEDSEFKNEVFSFVKEFEEAISSDIWTRIKLAEKFSKKKESVFQYFDFLELSLRQKMLDDSAGEMLKYSLILDKLTKTRELIKKNVNTQLAIEYLLLPE